MNRRYVMIGLVGAALILGVAASAEHGAWAAKESQNPPRVPIAVAVLDVNRFFKELKPFKTGLEKLKADVKKAEEKVKSDRDKLKSQREEIEKLSAGSDDRTKQEDEQNKLEAALDASISLQKKTFLSREADLFRVFYQRLEDEVAAYAKAHGIGVVVRITNEPLDSRKADSVLTYINRPVVWFSPEADITTIICDRIENRKDAPDESGK
jgi:Skp family chaperone for outer membrane proteins